MEARQLIPGTIQDNLRHLEGLRMRVYRVQLSLDASAPILATSWLCGDLHVSSTVQLPQLLQTTGALHLSCSCSCC